MKLKELKEKIHADGYSVKNGVFTLRWGFFYTMGKNTQTHIDKVKAVFPDAEILHAQEIWKAFSGGSSLANSSHWVVKFTLPTRTDAGEVKK